MNFIGTVAPAKINLGLEVVRKRADGYHDINSVFYRVPPVDRLLFTASDDPAITLVLRSPVPIPTEQNLVYRAAALLQERSGTRRGVHIALEKRIPSGAGLGGGSSDAATTLRALRDLWEVPVSDDELLQIGAQLGSDVPFFLLDRPAALAGGRGEVLTAVDLTLPFWTVIVHPGIHVSTPWAYSSVARTVEREPTDLLAVLRDPHPEQLQRLLVNDFEPVVFAAHPPLAAVKETLYAAGAVFALMSGSGSSVFGLFHTGDQARAAAAAFAHIPVTVGAPDALLASV